MSNLEIIQSLCEMLGKAQQIIRDQAALLSMHGIETFDGNLEKERNAALDAIATITNEIDSPDGLKGA